MAKASIDELTEIAAGLEGTAAIINLALPSMSIEDQVSIGQRLWSISRSALAALEPLKGSLRDEAVRRQRSTPGTVQFDANDGYGSRCRVSIPAPCLEIRKGADVEALKTLLGDRFHYLFKTQVSYKLQDDFKEQVKEVPASVARPLLDAVDMAPGTPKVFFEN